MVSLSGLGSRLIIFAPPEITKFEICFFKFWSRPRSKKIFIPVSSGGSSSWWAKTAFFGPSLKTYENLKIWFFFEKTYVEDTFNFRFCFEKIRTQDPFSVQNRLQISHRKFFGFRRIDNHMRRFLIFEINHYLDIILITNWKSRQFEG